MAASSDSAVASAQAITAMYEAYRARVRSYLVSRLGDRDVADDLTAETFAGAFASLQRRSPPRDELPWLLGIATFKLVDHWRRQCRDQRVLQATIDLHIRQSRGALTSMDADRARQVLERMERPYAQALALRYCEELSVPEIAQMLGRSVHATESLLARARRSFRAEMHVRTAEISIPATESVETGRPPTRPPSGRRDEVGT